MPWGLNGFAQSMGWAPGSRVLSNWWPRHKRGRAYGFYVFAAGMSSVLTYASGDGRARAGLGWRWIFRLPVLLCSRRRGVLLLVRDHPRDAGSRSAAGCRRRISDRRPRIIARRTFSRTLRARCLSNSLPRGMLAIGFQSLARLRAVDLGAGLFPRATITKKDPAGLLDQPVVADRHGAGRAGQRQS